MKTQELPSDTIIKIKAVPVGLDFERFFESIGFYPPRLLIIFDRLFWFSVKGIVAFLIATFLIYFFTHQLIVIN